MPSSRIEIEHTFHFQVGVARTKPLRAPVFPFNSGKWAWVYSPKTQSVTLECRDANKVIEVSSVKLVSWVDHKAWPERHAVEITQNGEAFPPRPDCLMTVAVGIPKGKGIVAKRWIGNARLVVVLGGQAGGDDVGGRVMTGISAGAGAPAPNQVGLGPDRAVARAMAVMAGLHAYIPGDVALCFPATGNELFVNATALEHASPYFKALFDSAENYEDTESEGVTESLFSFVEGEDDFLDVYVGSPPRGVTAKPAPATSKPAPAPSTIDLEPAVSDHRRVVVGDQSYHDFTAVLVWLLSGYVEFAPIDIRPIGLATATATALIPSAPSTDLADVSDVALPGPVSAATVAHVAATLKLDDLAALAMAKYELQLSIENVISELVSDAADYEAVKEAILVFASKHWQAVKNHSPMLKLEPGMVARLPNGSEIGARLFELARRV